MNRSRRVILATGGSLGDIHPVIAVGMALQTRGLTAVVATSVDYRAKIEAEGLTFREVGPSIARLEADTGLDLAQLTARIARSDRFLFENIMLAYAGKSTRQMIEASRDADIVAGLSFAVGARIAAEVLDKPFVSIALQPTTVFSVFDPPTLPAAPWLAPARGGLQLAINRLTLAIARQTTAPWTRGIDRIRAELGASPSPGDIFFDALRHADLALGLYSPLLSPRQPDAPATFEVVGYAAYDSDAGGPSVLPEALGAFLESGPEPLVFTLGSAAVNTPGDFYERGLAAARALGRRSILLVGPQGDCAIADGPDALALPYAPYSLLFPRAAAIVHQGGVGTTQQALRAGRPQLVVPHLGDQYDNAARVVRLGTGLTLSRTAFARRGEATLARLLEDAPARTAAARLGDLARQEDGAAAAAARIAGVAGRR